MHALTKGFRYIPCHITQLLVLTTPLTCTPITHQRDSSKMKLHSLSSHHYADGGVGEVFESTKHIWSLRGKHCCSRIQYI